MPNMARSDAKVFLIVFASLIGSLSGGAFAYIPPVYEAAPMPMSELKTVETLACTKQSGEILVSATGKALRGAKGTHLAANVACKSHRTADGYAIQWRTECTRYGGEWQCGKPEEAFDVQISSRVVEVRPGNVEVRIAADATRFMLSLLSPIKMNLPPSHIAQPIRWKRLNGHLELLGAGEFYRIRVEDACVGKKCFFNLLALYNCHYLGYEAQCADANSPAPNLPLTPPTP